MALLRHGSLSGSRAAQVLLDRHGLTATEVAACSSLLMLARLLHEDLIHQLLSRALRTRNRGSILVLPARISTVFERIHLLMVLLLRVRADRDCVEVKRLLQTVGCRGDASGHVDLRRVAVEVVDTSQDLGVLVRHALLPRVLRRLVALLRLGCLCYGAIE